MDTSLHMTQSFAKHILFLLLLLLLLLASAVCCSATPHDCQKQECGRIKNIRYPFRLYNESKTNCPYFSPFFELYCNPKTQKLYVLHNITAHNWTFRPLEVVAIFMNGSLIVDGTEQKAFLTYHNRSNCDYKNDTNSIILPPQRQLQGEVDSKRPLLPQNQGPYTISSENKFVSFGCSDGMFELGDISFYLSGEYRFYESKENIGGCSAWLGKNSTECGNHNHCCVYQLPLPPAGVYYNYGLVTVSDHQALPGIKGDCTANCSAIYAAFFHPDYTDWKKGSGRFYLSLNWGLPYFNGTEPNSISDTVCFNPNPGYDFSGNFSIAPEVEGYLCYCNPGYDGDGYANGTGCTDINECDPTSSSQLNQCIWGLSTCHNLNGSYTCKCKSLFFAGDGRHDGTGCHLSPHAKTAIATSCAILGFALLIGAFYILASCWRKRTKRKIFLQNGGLELEAYIRARGRDTARLFSAKELKAATMDYAEHMKLGVGGFGTVFKGVLEDGREVAIKKGHTSTDGNNEQFVNELSILTQVNHRHIVKLLGCCLETTTPLLVYEYVSNGNLAENLEAKGGGVMAWEQRLKVARQTADALAYLHAAASPPILHRDVKSANVLLDENMDAKVADFGVSRLLPKGISKHVSTAVQGTVGYLDPEYFQTLQLTDKSDVYSLGVMLVELITGLKPVDNHSREARYINLALLFAHHMQEGTVEELIDSRLEINPSHTLPTDTTWRIRSSILAVAALASCCISLIGVERPSMNYVADELRRITQASWGVDDEDEGEALSMPLLPFKVGNNYETAAVVLQNAEYYIQSSSSNNSGNSMSIDNIMMRSRTLPR